MSNKIRKKESNFTQLSNNFLRDSNISFKSKGLFCYMFSMDENWNFTMKSISTQQKDGLDSIKAAMDELKTYGYITYEKHSDGTGTYFLNDEPNVENPNVENPNVENPNLGKSTPIKNTNLDKNTNINIYHNFISELKEKAPIKSKITKTKQGKDLFNKIDNKKQLMDDYINHQIEKKEFASRITAYMEDYNSIYKKDLQIDYSNYLEIWNEFAEKHSLIKLKLLTSVNRQDLKERLNQYKNFFEIFKYSLIKASNSSYLMNSGYFSFEWLTKNDHNIIKVYEGKYDNKKNDLQEVIL